MTRLTSLVPLSLLACATMTALAQDAAGTPEATASETAAAAGSTVSPQAKFLVSDSRWHDDSKVLWDGFLSGLRGFEHFYEPIGQPLYFETPFNNTSARALFLYHTFDDDSQLQGGDLTVYALQIRLAITERLALIATKDGYSELNADALPEDEGWNDVAAGLKYVLIADKENDFVLTPGFRWQWGNGDAEVLQGDCQELSPFISVAKGWDKFHLIGNVTYRLPLEGDDGNDIFQWDVHADYELFDGFAPCLEIHGLHYLEDGDRLPLSVGGLDYTQLGSSDVAGSTVVWAGAGARFKFNPHMSTGATYEYGLTNHSADIMESRITVDFIFTW